MAFAKERPKCVSSNLRYLDKNMDGIIHTRGIVLYKLRYSDTSLIIKIYTEETGLQSYVIKGVGGKRSVGKMAQFEPLALLDVVAYKRAHHGLQYIKEVRSIHPYQSIPFDLTKNTILLFINEILYKVIREEEANPSLFHYIWDMLILLDNEETPLNDYPLIFLIRLMPLLGFTPLDNAGGDRLCFSVSEGTFFKEDTLNESLTNPELSRWLLSLLRLPQPQLSIPGMPGNMRRDLLQLLLDYCRNHLSGMGEIRSHLVLARVLAG